jgi:hypothetical protein
MIFVMIFMQDSFFKDEKVNILRQSRGYCQVWCMAY